MEDLMGEERELIDLYREHTQLVRDCLESFCEAFESFLEEGMTADTRELIEGVNESESEADRVRREIIKLLIEKRFLLSNTRRDFLTLLEYTDKVADYSESTLDYLMLESVEISGEDRKDLINIMKITADMFEYLQEAVDLVFRDYELALERVAEIEKMESDIDTLEKKLIERFSNRENLKPGEKALYRDILIMITDLSDIIEDAGDEIEVIVALRRL